MHEPVQNEDLKAQLDRIETCLIGDAKMGHRGLVWSRDDHERRLRAIERIVIYAGGGAFAIGGVFAIVKSLSEFIGK